MGGTRREKEGQPTTLSTLVVFTVTLMKCFSYFYIRINYVDVLIDIYQEEMLH